MTKRSIITAIIILFVVALNVTLFGAVFCLRKTTVMASSDVTISASDIIKTASLEDGKSIFMQNKQQALNNIENAYPELKVVQIKTVSVTKLEIKVRKRYPMFYAKHNNKFYTLDEELKVLYMSNEKPNNLILIDSSKLNITENTKQCSFLADKNLRSITYNMFVSMYNTVMVNNNYAERVDIINLISSIEFGTENTPQGKYDRLILNTSAGVVIDIGRPEKDLERKINTCFVTYNLKIDYQTSGTIKVYYNKSNEEVIAYFPG